MQWTFKKELLACFVILAILPLIFSNCFLIQIFQRTIAQKEEKEAAEQLSKLESVMLTRMDELEQCVDSLSKDPQIRAGINEQNRWKRSIVYNILYQETQGFRQYAGFHIYDAEGKCRYSTDDTNGTADMPVYWGILKVAKAHTSEMVMRSAIDYHVNRNLSMRAAKAIINSADECQGYIVLDFDKDNLDALFGNAYEGDQEFLLLDSFWEKVYSSKSAKADDVAQMLRNRRMNGEEISRQIGRMRYFIREIGTTDLYLAVGKPTVFTQEITAQLLVVLVIMTCISFVLCLIVAEFLSNSLSKPVRNLSDAMHNAQSGNLDIHLDYKGNDELGQLTHSFNHMVRELKNYMELQVRQQKELNDANIALMHAQLNPHFLYNTLDTMKWIAKANHISELATLAAGLARILRMSISEYKLISLEEELKLVECYVDIQRIRFHDSFSVDIEVPTELEDYQIPKLIIQPIVENAVIHGLAECEKGHIFVNIYEKQEILYIEVSDDGCGMDEELINLLNSRDRKKLRGHIGFCNVDTILRLYYGEQFGLHAQRLQPRGTRVTMTLPMCAQNNEED